MRFFIALVFFPIIIFGATVVHTIDAPDSKISGLGYGLGYLWAVSSSSKNVYKLDPSDGSVISSFSHTRGTPSGLTVRGSSVYVIRNDWCRDLGIVYKYTTAGVLKSTFSATC